MNDARQCLPARSAPSGAWIPLAEAARRLNCSERHARRRAGQDWLPAGLARVDADGKWEISTAADPALATDHQPLTTSLSPKLLKTAAFRKSIVERWRTKRSAAMQLNLDAEHATTVFLRDLVSEGVTGISRGTLYNWYSALKAGGGKLDALADGRQVRSIVNRQPSGPEDPFLAYARGLYEHENRRSIKLCHDNAMIKAAETGWIPASYATTKRYLKSLNPAELILRREGPKAFNDQCMPNIARDYTLIASNEMWVSDHHQLDVIVKVGERLHAPSGELRPVFARPWLTGWIDVRSRKMVSWAIRVQSPSTDPIVETFGDACLEYGVPECVYTDNGKDCDAAVFTGMTKRQPGRKRRQGDKETPLLPISSSPLLPISSPLLRFTTLHVTHDLPRLGGIYSALNIQHIHAGKEHGQSKVIERFFGTLCSRFSKEWETYTGRSPDEKPEGLADRLAAGKAPDFAEFVAGFATSIEAGYHNKAHFGDGMDGQTPNAVYAANRGTIRTAAQDMIETLCTPRELGRDRKGLLVHADGITWQGLTFGRGQLANHYGRRVAIRLRKDLLTATAWSIDDKQFLGVLDCNSRISPRASREVLREAIAEKKRDTNALKQSFLPRMRLHEDTADRMRRLASSTAGSGTAFPGGESSAIPPTYSPVRADLEDQLNAVQEAMESRATLRLAAGAEGMSHDDASAIKIALAAYGGRDE